jgi:hypothetical protein
MGDLVPANSLADQIRRPYVAAMRCKEIVPGYMLTLSGLLDAAECAAIVAEIEAMGWSGAAHHDGSRVGFHRPDLAWMLWHRLAPHVPTVLNGAVAVGLNEHFRGVRYLPGQRFERHIDRPKTIDELTHSQLSLVVSLNDDFRGGGTRFRHTRVQARRGSALLFRHELEHEPDPLAAGMKYVLRSDVLYRREGAHRRMDRRRRDGPRGLAAGRHS